MSRPKERGTSYETQVARYVNGWAGEAVCERVVLHGSRDEGDLRLRARGLTLAVECKWRRKYPNRAEELGFRDETDAEAANSGADGGVLVLNRYRNGTERHEAWMRLALACRLCGAECPEGRADAWACMRLGELCRLLFGPPAQETNGGSE